MSTKVSLLCVILFSVYGILPAQVKEIKYQIQYNVATDRFDCNAIVVDGSTNTITGRALLDARYSIIVPRGSKISISDRYMPLYDNINYNGSLPCKWQIDTTISAPINFPENDYYRIIATPGDGLHFNNLNQGDVIKLFSFRLDTIVGCANKVRLLDNDSNQIFGNNVINNVPFAQFWIQGNGIDIYKGNDVLPIQNFAGPDRTFCANATLNVMSQPPSTGIWRLLEGNANGATIDSISPSSANIFFNAIAKGTYTAVFSPNNILYDFLCIDLPEPQELIGGPLCIGKTFQLPSFPTGVWSSSNDAVATVNSTGLVTPVANGIVTFTFTPTLNPSCSSTTSAFTVFTPDIVAVTDNTLCPDETTTLTPVSGGTWSLSNTSIATLINGNTIQAVTAGSFTATFTNTSTTCTSTTTTITVFPKPSFVANINNQLCVGSTLQLSSNQVVTWTSTSPSILSVDNSGKLTGNAVGTATILISNGQCTTTVGLFAVNSTPIVSTLGINSICVGATTQLSPMSGGNWLAVDPTIALINNSGLVTGVSQGTARFTFNSTLGCSATTTPIVVESRPNIMVNGPTTIFPKQTTQLNISSGATLSKMDLPVSGVTTFTSAGLVTAVNCGTSTYIATQTATSCTSLPKEITVVNAPIVHSGSNTMCVGESRTFTNSNVSSNWSISGTPGVLSVNPNGVVTALMPGQAKVRYQYSPECGFVESETITVVQGPTITEPTSKKICIGSTAQLTAGIAGTWSSSDPTIANINNTGLITAITAGEVRFTFTTTDVNIVCRQSISSKYTIVAKPIASIDGPEVICVGQSTSLSPKSGGTWVFTNNIVAINLEEVVTGLQAGTVQFFFIDDANQCMSDPTNTLTIHPKPTVSVAGLTSICVGNNTQLLPNNNGIWLSNNPGVATVTSQGLVTGLSSGTSSFVFTSNQGCISDALTIEVNTPSAVSFIGNDFACAGSSAALAPTTGGVWTSDLPNIAGVSANGNISAINAGSTTFTFTSDVGCVVKSNTFTVRPLPSVSIVGPNNICVGRSSQLSPSSGGSWTASLIEVATINNGGLVTGVQAGQSFFTYKDAVTQCENKTGFITVVPSLPPVAETVSICPGESYTTSQATYNTAGVFNETRLGSNGGCDTSYNITISIYPTIDDSLVQNENSLVAAIGGTTYTWYRCNGTWVATTSEPSFKPLENGSYYVIIEEINCSVKTNCVDFILSALPYVEDAKVDIFPNPCFDLFKIKSSEDIQGITVRSYLGQLLWTQTSNVSDVNMRHQAAGVYLIEIKTKWGVVQKRILKI